MKHFIFLTVCGIGLLALLSACGPSVTGIKPQETVTISNSFQSQVSPVPTAPTYVCGAWSSDNAPGGYATIRIYAKLTKNLAGVPGATAIATIHFQSADVQLDQQESDNGGYVTFSLPLQGRQPAGVPATVDVTFTNFPGGTLKCTPAFFTPR